MATMQQLVAEVPREVRELLLEKFADADKIINAYEKFLNDLVAYTPYSPIGEGAREILKQMEPYHERNPQQGDDRTAINIEMVRDEDGPPDNRRD